MAPSLLSSLWFWGGSWEGHKLLGVGDTPQPCGDAYTVGAQLSVHPTAGEAVRSVSHPERASAFGPHSPTGSWPASSPPGKLLLGSQHSGTTAGDG